MSSSFLLDNNLFEGELEEVFSDDEKSSSICVKVSDFKKGKPIYEWQSLNGGNFHQQKRKPEIPDQNIIILDKNNEFLFNCKETYFQDGSKFKFWNCNFIEENFKKKALLLLDSIMNEKLEIHQKVQENEMFWNSQQKKFLVNNSNLKEFHVLSLETNEIISSLEELLKKDLLLIQRLEKILSLISSYIEGQDLKNEIKSDFEGRLMHLLKLLKNETNIISIEEMKNIQTNLLQILFFLRTDSRKFIKNLQKDFEKKKQFFIIVKESYQELILLSESYQQQIKIFKNLLNSSENEANLIFLPFNKRYPENQQLVTNSQKTLKKLDSKMEKFKNEFRNIKNYSSFFQVLKVNIKQEIKNEFKKLEEQICCVQDQIKLIFEFSRYENYIKALENFLNKEEMRNTYFTSNLSIDFYRRLNDLYLFLRVIQNQPKPLKIITIFQDFLTTNLFILKQKYQRIKNQLKESQIEEFQKIGSLKKEAENLAFQVQNHVEKNTLSKEERTLLKKNIKKLLQNIEILSKWPEINEFSLDHLLILKSELEKDFEVLVCFEEMSQTVSLQISFSSLKPLLNSLKISAKINLLKPFLKKLQLYHDTLSQIPIIYKPIKDLLARIVEILPCLLYFEKTFQEYNDKFITFSSDYEALKEEIWVLKETFLKKIHSLSTKKEDKEFFISCGEEFIISLKKHYESLTPENLTFLNNVGKHILFEMQSRINFFYTNKENLQNMAISYNRQKHLKDTLSHYFRIIDKLKLTYSTKSLDERRFEIAETEEILHRCKEIVENLLKISLFTSKILEKGLEPNKKVMKSKERFVCLKDFLKNMKEGKKILVSDINNISDDQIKSLFINLSDDIMKIEKYIEKIIPDIDKFIYYDDFFGNSKATNIRDQSFLLNLKGFLNFYKEVNNNPNTRKGILFQDFSSVNDLIQETYSLWYEGIMNFFLKFDIEWLEKLYICINILNKNPLKTLISETNDFMQKFIVKKEITDASSDAKDLITLGLFLKERILYFNEKFYNLQLSIFSLERLNNMNVVNNIFFADLELLKEEFKSTPDFYSWSDCFEITSKVLEAGERVYDIPHKKTFIIWKRAIAKLHLRKLKEYAADSSKLEEMQKIFLNLTIDMIQKYFFSLKKTIL